MTELLFRADAYARTADGVVEGFGPNGGVLLDRTVFYPAGGGQPGDLGTLAAGGPPVRVSEARKAGDAVELVCEPDSDLPDVGSAVRQELDWDRRHRHMRMHTALHLLSVVIPLPVTGGSIGADRSRLDFDMPEAVSDKAAIEAELNRLVERDLDVGEDWISDAELDANPTLVKTMSVQPPRGAGRVRLVRIGSAAETVDLQPCGGTHVAQTGEIGRVRLGKIEKKGRRNRRVSIHLD